MLTFGTETAKDVVMTMVSWCIKQIPICLWDNFYYSISDRHCHDSILYSGQRGNEYPQRATFTPKGQLLLQRSLAPPATEKVETPTPVKLQGWAFFVETLELQGFGAKNEVVNLVSKIDYLIWRSGRDSNPRAVSAATRFPIVLVMTTSIPLQVIASFSDSVGQRMLL